MFLSIKDALNYVMDRRSFHHGLDHFQRFMESQGDPQDHFRSIHVAGTNGKGSTVSYLAAMLEAAGYRVGTFTSPHLIAHQDRIRIQGQWIPDAVFLRLANQYRDLIEKWDLAMFEIDFFFACLWFIEQNVDLAVIEVGLGGLLDSTNTMHHPLCSLIVSIGYDHMDRLGAALSEIAEQKGGIIKPGGLTVIGHLDSESEAVVEQLCTERGAELVRCLPAELLDTNPVTFRIEGCRVQLKSTARYQAQNAALAWTCLEQLTRRDRLKVSPEQRIMGLWQARWPGRFERISESPLIILDGAHNVPGIEALIESLNDLPRPRVVVFTALKDKQTQTMAEELSASCEGLIITQFDYYRAAAAENLQVTGSQRIDDWKTAVYAGRSLSGKQGSLIITGSLYFISEVRAWLLDTMNPQSES